MHGRVIKNTGSFYDVRTDNGGARVPCKVKGNFRLRGIRSTNPVAVGDFVTIQKAENEEVGFITEIDERRNYIIRKASNLSKQSHILAANIDLALLVVTVARPETATTFIDRFLASAEAYRIPVALIVNKCDDLKTDAEKETAELWRYIYEPLGYPVVRTQLVEGNTSGIDDVKNLIAGKTVLLAGNSGVGKSTLLNALIPDAHVKTAEVSEQHGTGQHTTTFSQLIEGEGFELIDIPGIKGFGTFDITPEELSHYFREIFKISEGCRFDNCTHTHEPGCAVQEALENGEIAPSRFTSYLSMLEDQSESKYR